MTKEEIQQAADSAYEKEIDTHEHQAFIEGAQFVLDQQAKDVDKLKKEFEAWMHDRLGHSVSDLVFNWFLPYLNTQKEGPKGVVSEWQLCPKCGGTGRLNNGYTMTSIYSQ